MRRARNNDEVPLQPEVIVDFECEKDSLFIVIANVGSSSAHRISIVCDKEIKDFRGRQIARMGIFRKLEFLPPAKEIRTFVTTFSAYLKEKRPLQLNFSITYYDRHGRKQIDVIRHNLGIFREIVTSEDA